MNDDETITQRGSASVPTASLPRTYLVGAGVVGRAILRAHADAGLNVCLADQDASLLDLAIEQTIATNPGVQVVRAAIDADKISVVAFYFDDRSEDDNPVLVIESIAENLDAKRAFFVEAERVFGADAIFCSNTSTLRIESIASGLQRPDRVCGMHFFMPVDQRPAVEIVRASATSDTAIRSCQSHVQRLNKSGLLVADTPGFIVNRLLSPYLNQSLLLLTQGIAAERIEQAALQYGMPLSPLELIDFIGTRTMLSAGRCFWDAFPERLQPSLVVPRLVRKKRFGRHDNAGLYDYHEGQRSDQLSEVAQRIVSEYATDPIQASDQDLVGLLSIPMWIEAALAYRDGVTQSVSDFDAAMQGGLGYRSTRRWLERSWLEYWDSLGSQAIVDAIEKWSDAFVSMQAPDALLEAVRRMTPSQSLSCWSQV